MAHGPLSGVWGSGRHQHLCPKGRRVNEAAGQGVIPGGVVAGISCPLGESGTEWPLCLSLPHLPALSRPGQLAPWRWGDRNSTPAQNLLLAFAGWIQLQGRAQLWRSHQSALVSKGPTSPSRAQELRQHRQVRRQQEGLRIDLRVNLQARGEFSGHVCQGLWSQLSLKLMKKQRAGRTKSEKWVSGIWMRKRQGKSRESWAESGRKEIFFWN